MAEQYALILDPFANVKPLTGEGTTDPRQPPVRLLQQAQEAPAATKPQ
jgi:hypothetical protein